jgi:hypothetical protein
MKLLTVGKLRDSALVMALTLFSLLALTTPSKAQDSGSMASADGALTCTYELWEPWNEPGRSTQFQGRVYCNQTMANITVWLNIREYNDDTKEERLRDQRPFQGMENLSDTGILHVESVEAYYCDDSFTYYYRTEIVAWATAEDGSQVELIGAQPVWSYLECLGG